MASRPRASPQQIRPGVQRILDGLTQMPAIVHNGRLDILSANMLGYALFSPIYVESARPANHARFVFLDPRASACYPDWDLAVRFNSGPLAHRGRPKPVRPQPVRPRRGTFHAQ